MFKARCPVDLVLLLNVHDHGPVHVPPVVPCKLREAIGQGPEVASDHVKCKNNARNQDFLVRGSPSNTNNFDDKESAAQCKIKFFNNSLFLTHQTSDIIHSISKSKSKWHVKFNFLYYEMFLCVARACICSQCSWWLLLVAGYQLI